MKAASILYHDIRSHIGIPHLRGLIGWVLFFSSISAQGQEKLRWNDFGFLNTPPGQVQIEAESLTARGEGGPIVLRGGIQIHGDGLEIRADRMEILPDEERIILIDSVRVVEGKTVMLAERIELDQMSSRAVMKNAIILVKEETSGEKLGRCMVAYRLVEEGFNAMRLEGQTVMRRDDKYVVNHARFTACDCGQEVASWEIRAHRADIKPHDGAWMFWPRLYAKGIPVFILPFVYIPLSERRTGLLFPQVNYSGRDGFIFSESLFVTLGRSADTTLSLDWFEQRGWRERLELRMRPADRIGLDTRLMYMDDRKLYGDEKKRHLHRRKSVESRAWFQTQGGFDFRGDVLLYSDSDIKSDFASEMAGRAADQAKSTLIGIQSWSDQLLAFDMSYIQDLRYRGVDLLDLNVADPNRSGVGDTVHRLGAVSYAMQYHQTGDWPMSFSLWVEAINFSSLSAAWRDWGRDATPDAQEPQYSRPEQSGDRSGDNGPGGEADGILGDGELRRAQRTSIEPELRFAHSFASVLSTEIGLKHRQLVYIPHGPGSPGVSTRGLSRVRLDFHTRLARTYGVGDERMGHLIKPWMSILGLWPGLSTSDPYHTFDWQDRTTTDAQQLLVGVDSGLFGKNNRIGWDKLFEIRAYQGVDLKSRTISQGYLDLSARFPVGNGRSVMGVDWSSGRLSESSSVLNLHDRRGDGLRLAHVYLPSVRDPIGRPLPLSERVQREADFLFGDSLQYYRAMGESVHVLEASARFNIISGLNLSSGMSLNAKDLQLAYYQGGVSYRSDCRCFGFALTVRMVRGQDYPDVFFNLDLSYLGSMGLMSHDMF